MTEFLLLLLKLSFAVVVVSVGMGSAFADVAYLWRRPVLLLRSLLAMYVLVPLAAYLLVQVLPVGGTVKAVLLVLAVSAGAPLLPKKLGKLESDQYIFSLVVISALLAMIWVPLWVSWLGHYFDANVHLSPITVAKAIGTAFLLPLAIGMLIRVFLPKLAARFSDSLISIAGLVLSAAGVLLLIIHWQVLLQIGGLGFLSLLLMLAVALAIGHVMGGPGEDQRTTLAIACASRHIGIALIVASAFPGASTAVLLAAYVVGSILVSVPYLRWRSKRARA